MISERLTDRNFVYFLSKNIKGAGFMELDEDLQEVRSITREDVQKCASPHQEETENTLEFPEKTQAENKQDVN